MSPLFTPYGYGSFLIAIGSVLCLGVGLIASVIAGIFLDRTKAYLKLLRVCCIMGTICFLSAIWIAPLGNKYLVVTILILAGIAMVPVTPLGFAFSVELTHPVQPILVNGFILMCA